MSSPCTRCGGSGFLNTDQIDDRVCRRFDETGDHQVILNWIEAEKNHEVSVCDCCGNGEYWHGIPGEHYNNEDPAGYNGPYAYNGGLCECH